jgi:hypothetical protein
VDAGSREENASKQEAPGVREAMIVEPEAALIIFRFRRVG